MLERVFHNGLQNKRGYHGLRQVQRIRDAPFHPDAVAKSDMVDRVIFIHDPHLPGEGHLLVVAHEAVPQQMGQCRDEGLGAVGLFYACRLQNDVEGVEKEMRVDLAAQLLQAAPLHPVLHLECFGLLAVELPLDLIFLPQGIHLLGHGVFHPVECIG